MPGHLHLLKVTRNLHRYLGRWVPFQDDPRLVHGENEAHPGQGRGVRSRGWCVRVPSRPPPRLDDSPGGPHRTQRVAVLMAKARSGGRMRGVGTNGERRVREVRGTQVPSPGSSAPGVTGTCSIPSALTCNNLGKCRLPGELVRDPTPGVLLGAGHLGTPCLALPRFQAPGREAGVQHKPGRHPPDIRGPGRHQGPAVRTLPCTSGKRSDQDLNPVLWLHGPAVLGRGPHAPRRAESPPPRGMETKLVLLQHTDSLWGRGAHRCRQTVLLARL